MAGKSRRKFIKKVGAATVGLIAAPYILPSGRLFAASGTRLADHVVFVLFGGGIRNQESVKQMYLSDQGIASTGNIMQNMLSGAAPSSNLVYNPWTPILTSSLASQGTLFKEMRYLEGPTGHYNGHTVAMTGNYTQTGLNLNVNPEFPTVFEYYRKHSNPSKSALNAWWLSEALGPYPSLNYSRDPEYGAVYGANYLRPATALLNLGQQYYSDANAFQPDDVTRHEKMKSFLDNNFEQEVSGLPGIINAREDKEEIKRFLTQLLTGANPVEFPLPAGVSNAEITGDLINIAATWKVLERFKPELTVVNTFNLDVCHSDFSQYLRFLHKADYGVGWLWNKIQNDLEMANNTVMICMPEHGRNAQPNNLFDGNGLKAYDHTGDDNSREVFSLIVGPPGVVQQNKVVGSTITPVGESIDIVPTIAHVLGFDNDIPAGRLPGKVLNDAFV
jgi:hypothetical protein